MSELNTPKPPAWFTIKSASEYLQVGDQTLYRWMREGKITYRKVGDSTRFLQEDLDATVEVFPSEKEVDTPTMFCPVCHHDEMVSGDVRAMGLVSFHPKETKFWVLKESNVPVEAVMCMRCGNILLRGDTDKMEALRKGKAAQEENGEDTPGDAVTSDE